MNNLLPHMKHLYRVLEGSYEKYFDQSLLAIIIILALLLITIYEKDRLIRDQLVLYPWVLLFWVVNPIFIYILTTFIDFNVYWRFMWAFLPSVLISYAVYLLIEKHNSKLLKIITALLCSAIIILTGAPVYLNDNFQLRENWYKLPQPVIAVVDKIRNDDPQQNPLKIAVPIRLEPHIRQYDASILMVYGRNGDQYSSMEQGLGYEMRTLLNDESTATDEVALGRLLDILKQLNVSYLVMPEKIELKDAVILDDLQYLKSVEPYYIYRLNK